jgi:hypothetical protein
MIRRITNMPPRVTAEDVPNFGSASMITGYDTDLFSSGRPSHFRGSITGSKWSIYRGEGKEKYWLYRIVTFAPEDQDPFDEQYFVGNLALAIPSKDGEKPPPAMIQKFMDMAAGKDEISENELPKYEGRYLVPKLNKQNQPYALNKRSSWAQFCNKLRDAGVDVKAFTSTDAELIVGLFGEFSRVPQDQADSGPKKTTDKKGDEKKEEFMVLVPVEIDKAKAGGSAATSTKANASESVATTTPAAGASSFKKTVRNIILEILGDAPGNKIKKSALYARVPKAGGFDKEQKSQWDDFFGGTEENENINLEDVPGTLWDPKEKTLELDKGE